VTNRELNRLKRQRPFQPFRVITLDNEVYEVPRPECIFIAGDDVIIGTPYSHNPSPQVDDVFFCGTEHIARAELIS